MIGRSGVALVLALISSVACHGEEPRGRRRHSPTVARVGSEVMTVDDFDALIRRLPNAREIYASREKKRALLESEVQAMVLADATARLGLDQDPEVVRSRRQQAAALLIVARSTRR
jgi:hypothetical protein